MNRDRQQPPPPGQPSNLMNPHALAFLPREESLTPRDQPITPLNPRFAKREKIQPVNLYHKLFLKCIMHYNCVTLYKQLWGSL